MSAYLTPPSLPSFPFFFSSVISIFCPPYLSFLFYYYLLISFPSHHNSLSNQMTYSLWSYSVQVNWLHLRTMWMQHMVHVSLESTIKLKEKRRNQRATRRQCQIVNAGMFQELGLRRQADSGILEEYSAKGYWEQRYWGRRAPYLL